MIKRKIKTLFLNPLRSMRKLGRLVLKLLVKIIDPTFCFLYQPFRQNKKVQKFVIISTHRTGSTMLCDKLNSHPEITCNGELFLSKNRMRNVITTSKVVRRSAYLIRNLAPYFFYNSSGNINQVKPRPWVLKYFTTRIKECMITY